MTDEHGHPSEHGAREVAITVDGQRRELPAGHYLVSRLKALLQIPADYVIDEVVNGEFRELPDTSHIDIKGGEHFISHVRRGGSS
jgi:hypothetical protein